MTLNERRGLGYACSVLVLSFFYFVYSYRFYDPVSLKISGSSSGDASIQLDFDSGNGFTSYEHLPLALKASGDGSFKLSVDLPQLKISGLRVVGAPEELAKVKIDSAEAVTGENRVNIPLHGAALEARGLNLENERLHLGLLLFQLALSTFLAWLVWVLLTRVLPEEKFSWRRLYERVFVEEGRYFFWLIFFGTTAVHSLWLLAYWPGATTNDSWSSLHDVLKLKFTDWHPYVYGLYLLALMQFYRSLASIAFFQIISTAAVGAWIFYYVWRQDVRWYWLLPFILLFVFSIPIGLFNIVLWKDVPFSVAVWLFSFLLYRVQIKLETEKQFVKIPGWCFPLLGLFFILLLHSRHNGKVFYLFLPLLLVGRISRKHFASLLVFLATCFATLNVVIPNYFGMVKITGSAYHELRTVLAIMTHHNFYSKDRKHDIEVVEKFTGESWDRIRSLYPAQWFTISDFPGVVSKQMVQDGAPERGEFTKKFLSRLIMENMPIFLTARFFDFFHSIGLDSSDYSANTNYFENPLQLQGNNLGPPGVFLYGVSTAAWTPFPELTAEIKKIDSWSREYDGLKSPSVLVWNLAIFYLLMLAVIFLEKGTSAIGLSTLPTFIVSAGIFVIGAGESWRYFYYVYLVGLFIVPMYLAYRKERARAA